MTKPKVKDRRRSKEEIEYLINNRHLFEEGVTKEQRYRMRSWMEPCEQCGLFCREAPHYKSGHQPRERKRAPECSHPEEPKPRRARSIGPRPPRRLS